ncbi:hypothetical protein [Burkholderia ambifaria]|uniref:hypothetical protein n=1 Tax=Burkholderia ambifaria TaxID=152480 RepID=UPI001590F6FC|nr:hypothetical protein [Burkholderia ambifaria]
MTKIAASLGLAPKRIDGVNAPHQTSRTVGVRVAAFVRSLTRACSAQRGHGGQPPGAKAAASMSLVNRSGVCAMPMRMDSVKGGSPAFHARQIRESCEQIRSGASAWQRVADTLGVTDAAGRHALRRVAIDGAIRAIGAGETWVEVRKRFDLDDRDVTLWLEPAARDHAVRRVRKGGERPDVVARECALEDELTRRLLHNAAIEHVRTVIRQTPDDKWQTVAREWGLTSRLERARLVPVTEAYDELQRTRPAT